MSLNLQMGEVALKMAPFSSMKKKKGGIFIHENESVTMIIQSEVALNLHENSLELSSSIFLFFIFFFFFQ